MESETVKLQKVLAASGLGSRRVMESWIKEGRVTVNGDTANLGIRVTQGDRISVQGKPFSWPMKNTPRVYLMNKLSGWEVSQNPSTNAPSVFKFLPTIAIGRWLNVGRLDINTSGLILFTNDGDLANRLMHPSTGLDREYAVRVKAELSDEAMEQLRQGVMIDGKRQSFSDIRYYDGRAANHWYHVVLMEGRNREVKRLFESQGVLVSRLKRVRYGPVILPSWLKRGKSFELSTSDVRALCGLVGIDYGESKTPPVPKQDSRRSVLIPYPDLELR